MPILPTIGQTDVTAVLNHIGKHQDLGMTGFQVLFRDVDFEIAKTTAEGDVLLFCELLISKDDHATIVEDTLYRAECFIIREFRKIQTSNFGSKWSGAVVDNHTDPQSASGFGACPNTRFSARTLRWSL
jgi:hypothetical protein